MGLKVNFVFVLVCVVSVVNCLPKPRDSTVLQSESVITTEIKPVLKNLEESSTVKVESENPLKTEFEPAHKNFEEASTIKIDSENPLKTEFEPAHKNFEEASTIKIEHPEILIPGRVACEHIDATEDPICQEHCKPKGYAYGLCVSKICSCV